MSLKTSAFFGGKLAPPPDPMKMVIRDVRVAVRRLDRDEQSASKQEAVLLSKLKLSAGLGKIDSCQSHAKELVRLRNHSKVIGNTKSQLNGLSQRLTVVQSTSTIQKTLSGTTKLLLALNKNLSPQELQKTLIEFQKQNTIFADGQEIISETLDESFEAENESETVDTEVGKVFAEIGLESPILPSLRALPLTDTYSDIDLVRRLEALRSPGETH